MQLTKLAQTMSRILEKRSDKVKRSMEMDRLKKKGLIQLTPVGDVNERDSYTNRTLPPVYLKELMPKPMPAFKLKTGDY